MKRTLLIAVAVSALPSLALAHVSGRPRESKPGAEERFTVRVPTEGPVATTHVQLGVRHQGQAARKGDRFTRARNARDRKGSGSDARHVTASPIPRSS